MSALRAACVRRHWRRSLILTAVLLTAWCAVTVITSFFPEELNRYAFFGFPLGFYFAAQGSLLLFLLIVGIHVWLSNRYDAQFIREREALRQTREPTAPEFDQSRESNQGFTRS